MLVVLWIARNWIVCLTPECGFDVDIPAIFLRQQNSRLEDTAACTHFLPGELAFWSRIWLRATLYLIWDCRMKVHLDDIYYFWVVCSSGPSISGPTLDECIFAPRGFQETRLQWLVRSGVRVTTVIRRSVESVTTVVRVSKQRLRQQLITPFLPTSCTWKMFIVGKRRPRMKWEAQHVCTIGLEIFDVFSHQQTLGMEWKGIKNIYFTT